MHSTGIFLVWFLVRLVYFEFKKKHLISSQIMISIFDMKQYKLNRLSDDKKNSFFPQKSIFQIKRLII